jgi:hypothetical protein
MDRQYLYRWEIPKVGSNMEKILSDGGNRIGCYFSMVGSKKKSNACTKHHCIIERIYKIFTGG